MTSITRTLVVCAIASHITVARGHAQETPAAISPPALSSVEIYALPARPNATFHGGLLRGGRLELHAATMLDLIRYAWRISPDQVIGGPAWLDTIASNSSQQDPPTQPRKPLDPCCKPF
ncbi:MAG: hypothetical protein JWN34_737 [Bryobacterales bacterium]|nr:hypothetical protein [Bryobacterales bacterium]